MFNINSEKAKRRQEMSNSKILLCGLFFAVLHISNSIAQGPWSQGADMPTARYWYCIGVVNGKIYTIGGNGGGTMVEEYNPMTDTWTSKSPMPTGRSDLSGCVVDGKIYAIGGFSNGTSVEEYEPATDAWTEKTDMPDARWGHATCAVNGKIYVIGGARGWPVQELYDSIAVYDPATDTWTMGSPMQTLRWGISCSVVNEKIYVIGGTAASSGIETAESYSTVEIYDPETDTWLKTPVRGMPTARFGLASAVINGKIYAIGGGNVYYPTEAYTTVEVYDPDSNTWTVKSPMPVSRVALDACSVDGKIYLPGGGKFSVPYSELYIYDPGNETGIENNHLKSGNSRLYQNYPNPFKLLTTIRYSLPRPDFVSLKLYNHIGQEVEVLVNKYQTTGDYQIGWVAEEFPCGIYFYKLQTSEFSESKKLILQK